MDELSRLIDKQLANDNRDAIAELINNTQIGTPTRRAQPQSSSNLSALIEAGLVPNNVQRQPDEIGSLIGRLKGGLSNMVMKPITGIEKIIEDILQKEGGFVNDPVDRGGITNYGITKGAYAAYKGLSPSQVKDSDIKNLTPDVAKDIYNTLYIRKPGFDKVQSVLLQGQLADSSVNHGSTQATKLLQKSLKSLGFNVDVDGRLGPQTMRALNKAIAHKGEDAVNNNLVKHRVS